MKVLERSDARLVLEDNPVLLGCVLAVAIMVPTALGVVMLAAGNLLGLGLLVAGAFLAIPFVVFLRRVRVIFDRVMGRLTIRSATLFGQTETHFALSDIGGVGVETSVNTASSPNDHGIRSSTTHRPVLHLPGRVVPLTEVYSSGDGARQTAEAIRDWLGLPPETE